MSWVRKREAERKREGKRERESPGLLLNVCVYLQCDCDHQATSAHLDVDNLRCFAAGSDLFTGYGE